MVAPKKQFAPLLRRPNGVMKNKRDVKNRSSAFILIGSLCLLATISVKEIYAPNYITAKDGSTLMQLSHGCECELKSIECLKAIKCLPTGVSMDEKVATGVALRKALLKETEIDEEVTIDNAADPWGKGAQLGAVVSWLKWRDTGTIPRGLDDEHTTFVNPEKYSYCKKKDLNGKNCFIADFDREEELGEMEKNAISNIENDAKVIKAVKSKSKAMLDTMHEAEIEPYKYLLSFSHMAKMTFNIRPHIRSLYDQHLRTVMKGKKVENDKSIPHSALRVALHIRRGDACDHKKHGYAKKPSSMDSPAQPSGTRLCYDTSVYLKALKKVEKYSRKRHIVVYLATDHAGSLVDELKKKYRKVYKKYTWKYLDYSRKIFDYDTEKEGSFYIEDENNKFAADLGETAVLDLWHLSHGHVFVGNIGSRFGKFGWFSAMARHNYFVPYFTVDGKSPCCDIDEACGEIAPYIHSMENCLTFTHSSGHIRLNNGYWEIGNLKRKKAAMTGLGRAFSDMKDRVDEFAEEYMNRDEDDEDEDDEDDEDDEEDDSDESDE